MALRAITTRLAALPALALVAAGGAVLTATPAHADTVWDRVAACESSGNWSINTGNGFYGGLQFHPATWTGFGGGKYAAYAHQATKAQQIEIAQEVLKVQGPGAWPVCSVKAGLTVENGLASGGGSTSGTTSSSSGSTTRSNASASRTAARTSGAIAVDGVLGPQTYGALERWIGRSADGVWDSGDKAALQRKLGVSADGVVGPVTTRALQAKVGASADGVWGPQTTSALQSYLNSVL